MTTPDALTVLRELERELVAPVTAHSRYTLHVAETLAKWRARLEREQAEAKRLREHQPEPECHCLWDDCEHERYLGP